MPKLQVTENGDDPGLRVVICEELNSFRLYVTLKTIALYAQAIDRLAPTDDRLL
jgi:hypothetical protein